MRLETAKNRMEQEYAAGVIELAWNVRLKPFGGDYAAIDYYMHDSNRMTGVVEVKCRNHNHDAFPTVFLDVRKWLILTLAQVGLGVPALFVVRFLDGVYSINLDEINPSVHVISGNEARGLKGDIGPMITVDVGRMVKVG